MEGIKIIGLEIKTIENLQTGEVTEVRRHYIVSFENDINNFKEAVWKHCEIENNLHAPLDIIFKARINKSTQKHISYKNSCVYLGIFWFFIVYNFN